MALRDGVARPFARIERCAERRRESGLRFVGRAEVLLDLEDVEVRLASGERILLGLGGGERPCELRQSRVGLAGLPLDRGQRDERLDGRIRGSGALEEWTRGDEVARARF